MSTLQQTLQKAFTILTNTGRPLSYELTQVRGMLVTPERIIAFDDDALYLRYIQTLSSECYNVSLPESKSAYDTFFADCIHLKNQMATRTVFYEERYLSFITNLFENLKTPYYEIYKSALFAFDLTFQDQNILKQTLQSFYSLIIKSTPEKCHSIRKIAEHAPAYKNYSFLSESLISAILVDLLGLFAIDKNIWLSELITNLYHAEVNDYSVVHQELLLDSYFKKQIQFLESLSIQAQKDVTASLSIFLASQSLYFYEAKEPLPPSLLFGSFTTSKLGGQAIASEYLNTYAYNMNTQHYFSDPAIGREQEIRDLELILLSPKKSPILVGEAGVGKTSIVDGLVYRLQRGEVPDFLQNKRIFKLTTSSLLSGTKYVGEMEERFKHLMDELERFTDVILFVDEIHTIVGAGSTESSNNDIANMLKPYIDRGAIKLIGATTRQEYEHFLLPDRALSRRFYPISVEEPDCKLTYQILLGTIPSIEAKTKVCNTFSEQMTRELLYALIDVSRTEHQPEGLITRLPELPLTLLEMAFSYCALDSRQALSTEDIIMAVTHSNLLKNEVKKQFTLPPKITR